MAAFSALLRLLLLHRLVSLDDAVHFGQLCLEMEAVGRGDEGLNTGEPKNRPAPNPPAQRHLHLELPGLRNQPGSNGTEGIHPTESHH